MTRSFTDIPSLIPLIPCIALAVLVTLIICALLELAWGVWRHGIGPTPSSRVARAAIIKLCRDELLCDGRAGAERCVGKPHAELTHATIYELGSGWGGLTLRLAHELAAAPTSIPTLSVVGYEIGRLPHLVSEVSAGLSRLIRSRSSQTLAAVEFRRDDLARALMRDEGRSIYICYLCPEQMQRIADLLTEGSPVDHHSLNRGDVKRDQRRLEDGCKAITLISLTFALPGFEPNARYALPTLYRDQLYVYRLKRGSNQESASIARASAKSASVISPAS